MPQLSYPRYNVEAVAGLIKDLQASTRVTRTAQEVIGFGVAVAAVVGKPDQGSLPISTGAVILDDAGTFTAGDLVSVVNGVTITTTFGSDKDTSMAAHAAAIQALTFITSAVYVGATTHTITIVAAANVHLSVTTSVAGITGTMTITSTTYASSNSVTGISVRDTIESGNFRVNINDKAVATLANDALAASDIVNGSINGVAIAAVTFATSEAVTLQLVANSIMAVAGVDNVAVNTTLRTLTITLSPGLPLDSVILTVTDNALGSVAPSFSYVYSAQGVSITRNQALFVPTELMPVLRKGVIWMQCEEALTPASSAFVRIQATASFAVRGLLRNDADSGSCVAVTAINIVGDSITDPSGSALIVPVELNQP